MYTIQPKNKNELIDIIRQEIALKGKNCDLNFIDTSLITNMSDLFLEIDFNGDISNWDISNVLNMNFMFCMIIMI